MLQKFIAIAWCVGVGLVGGFLPADLLGDEPSASLVRPKMMEVFQRRGMDPKHAHPHAVGGAKRGAASVPVVVTLPEGEASENLQMKVAVLTHDEKPREVIPTITLPGILEGRELKTKLDVPAGGWYQLKVEVLAGEKVVAKASVEKFGVGELFVVAGQSYACGHNDEVLKVQDEAKRVVAYDLVKDAWRVADDPQPNLADGGTIWPPVGDHLAGVADVPVGFVNVAVGATSSMQWQPGGKLFENLELAGKRLGDFRAVLWQQGESDVIAKSTLETYVTNLVSVRDAASQSWGSKRPWIMAKSTLHPTVYNDPVHEGIIREGIDLLVAKYGFVAGPDTDLLDKENRGPANSRRHFSGIGQKRAALMWFASIWQAIQVEDRR
ncbi:MAG: sialate O-acetylesterase [Planctomycetaceae bacterium]